MSKEKYFTLFPNCVPVKGFKQSIICDLQFNRYRVIPNLLFEILENNNGKSVVELKSHYNGQFDLGIDSYFDYFNAHDWGIYTAFPLDFPKLDFSSETPQVLKNAIIDVDILSIETIRVSIQKLSDVDCNEVQLRFFQSISLMDLEEVLGHFTGSNILALEILLPYTEELNEIVARRLLSEHVIIRRLVITASPFYKAVTLDNRIYYGSAVYVSQKVTSCEACGVVNKQYFNSDIKLFSEAKHFNTCLNKKMSIDVKGNVKNCPSLPASFGDIFTADLGAIAVSEEFTSPWYITKDQVEICKDCEFRYICTDCRAYVMDSSNRLSKPLKCKYDPYEAVWKS